MLADITVSRRLYLKTNQKLWASGSEYQSRLIKALHKGDAWAARSTLLAHMRIAHELMVLKEADVTQRFLPEVDVI